MKISKIFFLTISIFALSFCNNAPTNKEIKTSNSDVINEISKNITKDPNNPDLYQARAKIYFNNKNVVSAISDIQKAISIDSTNASYYYDLSEYYFAENKTRNVKEMLEKCIQLNPNHINAALKLAELYMYVKNYDQSLTYIDKALSIEKNNAKAYFIKGYIQKEIGDTTKSILSFLSAVESNPKYYEAYIQLGILSSAKKDKNAEGYFKNAINIDPSSMEANYDLAMFYQENGEYDKSIQTYEHILMINPTYSRANHNLGYIYLFLINKINLLPTNISTYQNKIKQDEKLRKDIQTSINYFTNAIRSNSVYVEAYYHRGLAYELLKDKTEARNNYKKALEINPDYKLATIGLKRI